MALQSNLDDTMYDREDKITGGQLGQCNSGNLKFGSPVCQDLLQNTRRVGD